MQVGPFSVNHPVLLNILMIALLILGGISLGRLPREQFSEVPFYYVNIRVTYPGVSAEDMEKLVTIPVENEMQGLDELDKIQSVTSESLSSVQIQFKSGISSRKFDRLYQDVRTRFGRVSLPEDIQEAAIDDFSSNDFLPVIEVVLTGNGSYPRLRRAADLLSDRLIRIQDVSSIDLIGSRSRQIFLEASRPRLEALGISVLEIVSSLQENNSNVPAGSIISDDRQFLVRTIGEEKEVSQLENIVVRRDAAGGNVKIRDLALILDGYDPRGVRARYNGETAVLLRIAKIPGGNSVGIIENVRKETHRWQAKAFSDIHVAFQSDSSRQINKSINVLIKNAFFGLIFLVLLLFIFVGIRNALMTALGIPVTFAVVFLILELSGKTFNSNTLFALVLVLGLIVDHAIVIIENSFRMEQNGLSRREAAVEGTNQVVIPVVAATATTVAAFIPLMILPGTIGKFLRVIPLTVSIALVVSTIEAVFFLPSHYADWPGGRRSARTEEPRFGVFRRWFRKLISRLYRKKGWTVFIFLTFMAVVFSLVPRLKQDLFSAEDFTLFYIDLDLPAGSPLDRTDRLAARFEKKLLPLIGNGEVTGVGSYIGFRGDSGGNTVRGNTAQIVVDLAEQDEGRTRSIQKILDEIKDMTAFIPGADQVAFRKAVNGPPTSPPVSFRLFGNSYNDLSIVSTVLMEKLREFPELMNIKNNYESGTPEIRIVIDKDLASLYGLTASYVGQYLRASLEGLRAGTFFQDNEEIEILIGFSALGNLRVEDLAQLKIQAPSGLSVPLSSVCRLEQGNALASIRRLDGFREITIEADTRDKSRIRQINRAVEELFESRFSRRYPDMRLVTGGEFSEFNDLLSQIARIFLLGLFLIYLILGAQFNSYTQPLLILLTVPFAFTGVVLFLFLSGTPFSTTVLYSGVALAGIAVNDSIVLISFINQLRKEGLSVGDAVTKAAETRLRPIVLTSLTTIAGLLPTAVGLGGSSVVWGPMASTIVFGLLFSTLTALLLIPCFYGIFFDRSGKEQTS